MPESIRGEVERLRDRYQPLINSGVCAGAYEGFVDELSAILDAHPDQGKRLYACKRNNAIYAQPCDECESDPCPTPSDQEGEPRLREWLTDQVADNRLNPFFPGTVSHAQTQGHAAAYQRVLNFLDRVDEFAPSDQEGEQDFRPCARCGHPKDDHADTDQKFCLVRRGPKRCECERWVRPSDQEGERNVLRAAYAACLREADASVIPGCEAVAEILSDALADLASDQDDEPGMKWSDDTGPSGERVPVPVSDQERERCGGSPGVPHTVPRHGTGSEMICPGCPDCQGERCPTCESDDPATDIDEFGNETDREHLRRSERCPDSFHHPAPPVQEPQTVFECEECGHATSIRCRRCGKPGAVRYFDGEGEEIFLCDKNTNECARKFWNEEPDTSGPGWPE